ncbi:MAG: undecaprenyl-phosphate glucose phosphotransferase [Oscillospiraceae bacterium]|nr:undecaprenyl-phosphate glucose phosphotransferase [Oscillospiraceae bacterium]
MINRENRFFTNLNILLDVVLIVFAYYLSVFIRFIVLHGVVSLALWELPYVLMVVVYAIGVTAIYNAMGIYQHYRYRRTNSRVLKMFAVNLFAIAVMTSCFFVYRLEDFSRGVLICMWILASSFTIMRSFAADKYIKRSIRKGNHQKHVIIFGNGHLAKEFKEAVEADPSSGIVVDGYVSKVARPELGTNLGSYEELEQILDDRTVDILVVALETHELNFMQYAITCAERNGVRISLIPSFSRYMPRHIRVEELEHIKLIDMRAIPLDNPGAAAIKRAMDIIGSVLLIALTSPIMLFAAIGVRLSGPGPVVFVQDRVGKEKKPFRMYKFRSMRLNTESQTAWSQNTDPRKTKFGSFIRKLSIDELPQLFNVLKGDMSLVGPRPEIPFYVRQFREDVPLYLLRQQVRPGMTGWAQVHGLRGDTSIEERVKYDIWYINHWSVSLDIKILLKTIFGGFVNNEVVEK